MKRRTIINIPTDNVRLDTPKDELSNNPSFDYAVKLFIADRQSRNLSEETIKYYKQKLSLYKRRYYEMYGSNPRRAILRRNIDDFVTYHTITLDNKLSSAQACLRALKAYCSFLVSEGLEKDNPFDDYTLRKPKKTVIKTFSVQQIERLLHQPDLNTFTGFRDYVILLTLLDTGIRIRELESINVDDVVLNENYISIYGKNGSYRNVPVSSQLKKALSQYMKVRGYSDSEALFISSLDSRFLRRSIQDRITMYGRKANIQDVRCSPHTFRHTFAKMYIKNGGNIFVLQDILGHSTLEMVREYVRLFSNDLYNDHKRHNPLGTIYKI